MSIKTSLPPRLRQFVRDYRLPLVATLLFIGLVIFMSAGRMHDRAVLGEILSVSGSTGQDYAALLSKDSPDGFQRNDVPADENGEQVSRSSGSRQITINTSPANGTTSTSPSASSSPASPPPASPSPAPGPSPAPAIFSASISDFGQSRAAELQCSSGSATGGNILKCSKVYSFAANIKTLNGPGTVNYEWRYSVSGSANGSYAASSGTNITPVSNQLTLSCRDAGTFTAQLVVTRPGSVASQTLTINHSCP